MAQGQKRNQPLLLQASQALNQFKYEVANELGIDQSKIVGDYWGNLTSRDCGAVGGNMVRRMIAAAEQALIEQATAGVKAGFAQGLAQGLPQVGQAGFGPTITSQ